MRQFNRDIARKSNPGQAISSASYEDISRSYRQTSRARNIIEYKEQRDHQDSAVLYSSFQPLVNGLIHRYGDDPELREDLKSEIYYRFCLLLSSYDTSRNIPLRPYLITQLSASVYTYVRQQRLRKMREVSCEPEMEAAFFPNAIDPSEQWNDNLVLQEVLRHLPVVLYQLSQRQRQVVIWRYYEERSYEEIADRLAIKMTTVRSLLRHGLRNMRRMLEEKAVSID